MSLTGATRTSSLGALAIALAHGVLLGSLSPRVEAENRIYTCVDAQGRKLSSDRMIPECQTREQSLRNRDGSVRAAVPPLLSVDAQQRIEQERSQVLQQKVDEEEGRRRDRVLLRRYPDRASHDLARQRALDPVLEAKQLHQRRVTQLQEELGRTRGMSDEAARERKASLSMMMDTQRGFIRSRDQEIARINEQMDAELRRLEPLWIELATASGINPATLVRPMAASAPASATSAGGR